MAEVRKSLNKNAETEMNEEASKKAREKKVLEDRYR